MIKTQKFSAIKLRIKSEWSHASKLPLTPHPFPPPPTQNNPSSLRKRVDEEGPATVLGLSSPCNHRDGDSGISRFKHVTHLTPNKRSASLVIDQICRMENLSVINSDDPRSSKLKSTQIYFFCLFNLGLFTFYFALIKAKRLDCFFFNLIKYCFINYKKKQKTTK